MASSIFNMDKQLKYHDFTATSGSDGFINTNLPSSTIIVNAYAIGVLIMPLVANNKWSFMVTYSDGTYIKPYKNQSITIVYYTLE